MQVLSIYFYALCLMLSLDIGAQTAVIFPNIQNSPACKAVENYQECAAIFYEGQLLVDEYTPKGKCQLGEGMKGKLSVATVLMSDAPTIPVKAIRFNVAIQNNRTKTLWMYSQEPLWEVQLEDILNKCEKGDQILILTVDQTYSLPHHLIRIGEGC